MFELEIPGFGLMRLEHLVCDFTGTLSIDGKLLPGVREKLEEITKFLKVHILTSDTFGAAKAELEGINCEIHILEGAAHDMQKEEYVTRLGAEKVMALGNGNNDGKMLKAAGIGIAVCQKEGCAAAALQSAEMVVTSVIDALELLLKPLRFKATLRF